jgi:hypothetical protein
LEEGRIRTCRRPRFSALEIVFKQSAKTDMRTMMIKLKKSDYIEEEKKKQSASSE